MGRAVAAFLPLLGIVGLSGCIQIDYTLDILPDGTGRGAIALYAAPGLADGSPSNAVALPCREWMDPGTLGLGDGVAITRTEMVRRKDGYEGLETDFTFNSAARLLSGTNILPLRLRRLRNDVYVLATTNAYHLRRGMDSSDRFGGMIGQALSSDDWIAAQLKVALRGLRFRYAVSLPGEVLETSGHRLDSRKVEAVWDVDAQSLEEFKVAQTNLNAWGDFWVTFRWPGGPALIPLGDSGSAVFPPADLSACWKTGSVTLVAKEDAKLTPDVRVMLKRATLTRRRDLVRQRRSATLEIETRFEFRSPALFPIEIQVADPPAFPLKATLRNQKSSGPSDGEGWTMEKDSAKGFSASRTYVYDLQDANPEPLRIPDWDLAFDIEAAEIVGSAWKGRHRFHAKATFRDLVLP
jgi:hypothetical protein